MTSKVDKGIVTIQDICGVDVPTGPGQNIDVDVEFDKPGWELVGIYGEAFSGELSETPERQRADRDLDRKQHLAIHQRTGSRLRQQPAVSLEHVCGLGVVAPQSP
jgi:hypothetical protein